jgi:hypothetical protein
MFVRRLSQLKELEKTARSLRHGSLMLEHPRSTLPEQCKHLITVISAGLFLLGLFVVSQGRAPLLQRFAALVAVLISDGVMALGWILSAVGWGWVGRRALLGVGGELLVTQVPLGVGTLLLLDWLLAWAGWMTPSMAWGLGLTGWALLIAQAHCAGHTVRRPDLSLGLKWPAVVAMPAVALLLGASTVAPGALWSSEFGGYDVLEYHLQLPREWLERGAMTGLPHNAYSYLPNLFEAAFLHLGEWRGSVLNACYAAQLLHAAMALLTALAIASIIRRGLRNSDMLMPFTGLTGSNGPSSGTPAALIAGMYLAVPWTIVTGSMAYNEQAMMAFGAVALMLSLEDDDGHCRGLSHFRRGTAVGLLCGLAALCKLSALGLIVAPVMVVLVMQARGGWRAWAARATGFAVACGVVVSLWGVRNFTWTGNPLFPMATQWFGTGHWTTQQAMRWTAAHSPSLPLTQRIQHLLDGFGHPQFGYLIWPTALLGAVVGLWRPAYRRCTGLMLVAAAVQLVFWLFFTHMQSRFLIPLLLPAFVLIGLAIEGVRPRAATIIIATALVFWLTMLDYDLYVTAHGKAALFIDAVPLVQDQVEPYRTINALPPHSKVYAEGFSTPLYVETPMTYHTGWDASPLGPALGRGGSAEANRWLCQEGYSHVLIDWGMLRRWMTSGNYGYDPSITLEALQTLADDALKPETRWVTMTLYRVRCP